MEYNWPARTKTYEGCMFTRSLPATRAKSYRKITCQFANLTVANTPRSPGYDPRAAFVVFLVKMWYWDRFSFKYFFFPRQCHSPSRPYSFIHLSPTLCNLSNRQRRYEIHWKTTQATFIRLSVLATKYLFQNLQLFLIHLLSMPAFTSFAAILLLNYCVQKKRNKKPGK